MALVSAARPTRRIKFPLMLAVIAIAWIARPAFASTYAAYIPLDSSIYDELGTLNDLGLADSYLSEIQPISRVEAARIVVEAESKLSEMQNQNALAKSVISELRLQLPDEVQWIEDDHEDNLPTMFHPVERVEGEYVLSEGTRRALNTNTGDQSKNPMEPESITRKGLRFCRTTTTCPPIRGAMKSCAGRDGAESAGSSPVTVKAHSPVRSPIVRARQVARSC